MSLNGKQVLVTGAGGFIASHLTEALVRQGARTRVLVHYNGRGDWGHLSSLENALGQSIEVIAGDVRDSAAVRRAVDGCQIVFHLAALIGIPYSYQAARSYVQTNVEGTLNVLEACRESGVDRLLHTSTSEVYGTAQYTPIDEKHPLNAQSPYAATKLAADQLATSYYSSFGVPVVIIRPFNTYGPRQSARAVIPTIITQALAGNQIELGSTSPVRDLVFVSDNVRGFLKAAEADGVCGEVINLGTGRGVSIGQLVELIGGELGRELVVRTVSSRQRPQGSEVLELVSCATKAKRLLDWQPSLSLEQGLARTISWIEQHQAAFRPKLYAV